jgi:hypothetical protein
MPIKTLTTSNGGMTSENTQTRVCISSLMIEDFLCPKNCLFS